MNNFMAMLAKVLEAFHGLLNMELFITVQLRDLLENATLRTICTGVVGRRQHIQSIIKAMPPDGNDKLIHLRWVLWIVE